MKRPLLFAILAVTAVFAYALTVAPAFAAPVNQESQPIIVQPAPDAPVRDVVQIIGTAVHPEFQRYELYFAPSPVPSDQSWTFIGDAHNNQQPLGLLGTWDSRSVPDGAYALRVRVVKQDGNYIDSDIRRVIVTNTRPAETPTPEVTDTPLPELPPTEAPSGNQPTIEQPTIEQPTVVVEIPTIAPTPTLEPGDTTALATPASGAREATPTRRVITASGSTSGGSGDSGSVSDIAGQLFNGSRLMDTAKKAAMYTAGGFLAIGLFFGVKGVLVWLWYKIKP
jgi:hypothetical protein